MTNFEWLMSLENKELIKKLLVSGISVKSNGDVCECHHTKCKECIFRADSSGTCDVLMKKWLNAERTTYTIPVNTPIDTKVLVSDFGDVWQKRYFAGFNEHKEKPYLAFRGGASSWSNGKHEPLEWRYCRLAEGSEE